MWFGPTVKIAGLVMEDEPRFVDRLSWSVAYKRGYREPRYPVPALYHYDTDPCQCDSMEVLFNVVFHGLHIYYEHSRYVITSFEISTEEL